MENNLKIYLVGMAVGAIIGGYVGHKLFPTTNTEVKIETKEVVKVETKTQQKVVEHVAPNGTIDREYTILTDKFEEKSLSQIATAPVLKNYRAGILVSRDLTRQTNTESLIISRRLVGNLFVDGSISTDKRIGLGLTIEF